MVAELVQHGDGWKTRPDLIKAVQRDSIIAANPNADALRQRSLKALEAKRLAAQQRFQERMAEPVTSHKPQLIEIRAADVRFDPRYQTDDRYDEARARKIAENWDWNTPSLPIAVNIRPDDLTQTPWCPDGRHRTNAALMRFGTDVLIPAVLHRVSYAEEAAMFAHQDENRKRVSDALKFNAGKEAGEPMPLEAQAVANRLGLILAGQAGHRKVATKTFLELIRMKGVQPTERALGLLLARWNGSADSLDSRLIKGMTFFVDRYQDHPNFKLAKLQKVLDKFEVEKLMQESTKYQINGAHKKIAAALVGLYNYDRPQPNRLPEWGVR